MNKLASFVRTGLATVAITAASVVAFGAGPAAAAPTPHWFYAGTYATAAACQSAGAEGAAAGSWGAYRCTGNSAGFALYVVTFEDPNR